MPAVRLRSAIFNFENADKPIKIGRASGHRAQRCARRFERFPHAVDILRARASLRDCRLVKEHETLRMRKLLGLNSSEGDVATGKKTGTGPATCGRGAATPGLASTLPVVVQRLVQRTTLAYVRSLASIDSYGDFAHLGVR